MIGATGIAYLVLETTLKDEENEFPFCHGRKEWVSLHLSPLPYALSFIHTTIWSVAPSIPPRTRQAWRVRLLTYIYKHPRRVHSQQFVTHSCKWRRRENLRCDQLHFNLVEFLKLHNADFSKTIIKIYSRGAIRLFYSHDRVPNAPPPT